jgi:hypothetical protein
MPTIEHECLLPEEIVVAVLHKVGKARIVDDVRLAKIFDDAAKKSQGIFKQFSWDPQYRYSRILTDAVQALDHGGSIRRENPASNYFSITEHTAGPYGGALYSKLSPEDQGAVDEIATKIQKTFGTGDAS